MESYCLIRSMRKCDWNRSLSVTGVSTNGRSKARSGYQHKIVC